MESSQVARSALLELLTRQRQSHGKGSTTQLFRAMQTLTTAVETFLSEVRRVCTEVGVDADRVLPTALQADAAVKLADRIAAMEDIGLWWLYAQWCMRELGPAPFSPQTELDVAQALCNEAFSAYLRRAKQAGDEKAAASASAVLSAQVAPCAPAEPCPVPFGPVQFGKGTEIVVGNVPGADLHVDRVCLESYGSQISYGAQIAATPASGRSSLTSSSSSTDSSDSDKSADDADDATGKCPMAPKDPFAGSTPLVLLPCTKSAIDGSTAPPIMIELDSAANRFCLTGDQYGLGASRCLWITYEDGRLVKCGHHAASDDIVCEEHQKQATNPSF